MNKQEIVKEGVGAGGISVASINLSHGEITIDKIQAKVEEEYIIPSTCFLSQ